MLSEKQFRERAKSELRHIGNQVLSLATDRDLYWKLEREIVAPNPQLRDTRNDFLDLVRACYADAMAARILHLLNGEDGGVSLPRVLAQLAEYPEMLHDKLTPREFANDRGALERSAAQLKLAVAPHVGHHERTLSALAAVNRELDAALDLMLATVKTYYWIVADSYIDLDIKYSDNPLTVFQSAWTVPVLAR
jgi:hypothetical protein